MQASVIFSDLFEHGSLPFVGREREIQRIVDFWRSTILAERLRALIITGEAGSGKSRLLEAVIPIIAQQGGAVAHLKLYHDATTAIAPLVLESLRSSNLFRHVSRSGSGTPLSMAAQALRRIARLRPLLLVVEDIQLLEGEALQELNQLLEMMADEPISALFATRPVKQGARAVVERYLVDEIPLAGLRGEEIAEMLERVFGVKPVQGIVANVQRATLGNPLALRSALRELMRHGKLFAAGDTLAQSGSSRHGMLDHALAQRVGLLAEGMVAHLDSMELEAAVTIATLGEVFAREAAHVLFPGADALIGMLERRGILMELTTPAIPIGVRGSEFPLLTFSHSLLHKYLLERASLGVDELVRLLASNPPLYSLLPIQLIAQHETLSGPIVPSLLQKAIGCVQETIHNILESGDSRSAPSLCKGIDRLYSAHRDEFSPLEQLELEISLDNMRLTSMMREPWSEEMQELARRLLERTSDISLEACANMRLNALEHWLMVQGKRAVIDLEFVLREEERFIAQYPEWMAKKAYVEFLEYVAAHSRPFGERSYLSAIEQRMVNVLLAPGVPDAIKRFARRKLSPLLLREFSTPEELEVKKELARELRAEATHEDMYLLTEMFLFLESIGEIETEVAEVRRWRAEFFRRGQYLYAQHLRSTLWRAEAFLGSDFEDYDEMIANVLALNPTPLPGYFESQFGRTLVAMGMFCGRLEWVRMIIARFPKCEPAIWPEMRIILALNADNHDALRSIAGENPDTPLGTLAGMLAGSIDLDGALARSSAEQVARQYLLRHIDVIRRSALLALVTAIDARFPELELPNQLGRVLQRTLTEALEWAAERKLPPVVRMLLDNHARLLAPKQRSLWNNRLNAITEERNNLFNAHPDRPPVAVTMIGTISVAKLRAEPHRLRGERMRILLALMVANTIVAKQLPHEEFAAIATGIEGDPEAARLSLTHMVYRLRETIGTQAVITANAQAGAGNGSTPATPGATIPQLNPAVVDVDLIRAWRALQTATEALADGFLVKAARCIAEVIDTVGTDIIFPTLYDSFFEALRSDLEGRLHQLLLAIAGRLAEEGDIEGGEALLQRGFAMMPDDEEIAEHLQEMLISLDRHADADRIRARVQRSLRGESR